MFRKLRGHDGRQACRVVQFPFVLQEPDKPWEVKSQGQMWEILTGFGGKMFACYTACLEESLDAVTLLE